MKPSSLRGQLVAIGLAASIMPLAILVLVVFGVEEDETVDSTGTEVAVTAESGVSPWIPVAATVLAGVAIVVVWWWAKRAVDPIERMTRLTDEIQAGSLDRRLELDRAPEEIRALAESFDHMLDRLASASVQERELLEDASHELRTPLAALAARLEVTRRRAEGTPLASELIACDEEVDRLRTTLDRLLDSARARQRATEQVDNDVVAIVRRVVERQRLVSPDVPISLDAVESVRLGIDGPSVERAVANLVANAVEHGLGTPVAVTVEASHDAVAINVSDAGPGIAAAVLPRIFDRYTGDHHGLGLALVKQVADVYGSIEVESPVGDSVGACFTLRLQRSPRRLPDS